MEGVDVSSQFKSTSLAVPSPTASHVACLSGARLQIRSLTTFEVLRSINQPSSHGGRTSRIAWSPPTTNSLRASTSRPSSASTPPRRSSRTRRPLSNRVLVSDEDTTRVYDLRDENWNAVISNGSGGMGKNVHVEFGASEDEVLVWSDFTACVKIWCLQTGKAVEIRDPKFVGREGKGWGYRRGRGKGGEVLALLCRSAGVDVLLLLAPRTYTVLNRIELPTTDAAGLKWSRDGRWLAVWDAASSGYKLCIYTADGHLYRTITREPADEANEWGVEGLGIKSVEWVSGNTWLAIGGWDRRVRILSTRTFAPVVFLDHTAIIHIPSTPVYTELVDGQANRNYALTSQPTTPPNAPLEKNETPLMKHGISLMAFNHDGTLCATRDDSTPSTVWIWDLRSLTPRMICIQYAPVKALTWHPADPSRLLIQTIHDAPIVYLYTAPHLSSSLTGPSSFSSSSSSSSSAAAAAQPPTIITLSPHFFPRLPAAPVKYTASWLASSPAVKKPVFLLACPHAFLAVWPEGKERMLRFEREGGGEGEGGDGGSASEDSLFEILTGRKTGGRERGGDRDVEGVWKREAQDGDEEMEMEDAGLDDTFRDVRGQGRRRGMGSREVEWERESQGRSDGDTDMQRGQGGALDDSGLSEMF